MTALAPGMYVDYDTAAYYDDPCPEPSLTQSIAKVLIEKSPLHAWWEHPRLGCERGELDPYDKVRAIANAAHSLILGRGRDLAILDHDDFRSHKARDEREALEAQGRIVILEEHFAIAKSMHRAAVAQLGEHEASDAFTKGSGEVMIMAEKAGCWFRSLVDWLHNDLRAADDFKTTAGSVAAHALAHKAETDGWHVQAAMQEFILDIVDPANAGRRRFRFIAQENYQPYALNVIEMTEHWMTMGRKKLQYAIDLWAQCTSTGNWPSYKPTIVRPDYPTYAEKRWLEREEQHAFERKPFKQNGMLGADHLLAG